MSSLRGRKRGGKSPNANEAGPSTRGKKTTIEETSARPLEGKVIYLDVVKKSSKVIDNLKADLKELGARVEPFLSKDITYLFSDRPEAAEFSKSQNYPSGASPAVSTPSPFQQWKDSGAADSPVEPGSSSNNTVRVMTRGRAIANKADTSSRTTGSTDVLNNARNMGIPVKCLDKILNYCEREKEKLRKTGGIPKEKGEASGQKSKKKERQLQHHFLKSEDLSRRYRPITKEMDIWPRMVVDSGDSRSPFIGRVPPTHTQRDDTVALHATNTPQKASEPAEQTRKSGQKSVKKSARKSKTPVAKKPKEAMGGYCECCRGRYSDLEEHMEGTVHQYFVKNQSNYTSLDAMITEGPDMEQFLQDCLEYHESSNSAAEKNPSEQDEVMLISEVGSVKENLPKEGEPPSTPKGKTVGAKQGVARSESPKRRESPPKTSTPQKKPRSKSTRRRSVVSPDGAIDESIEEETVQARLSPQRPEEGQGEPRPNMQPSLHGDCEEIVEVISSSPLGKHRTGGTRPSAGGVSGVAKRRRKNGNEQDIPNVGEISAYKSPPKQISVTAMTPLSPRSRLSLTRRRRRQLLDMSPSYPPSKRKKLRDAPQGSELGVIDCELPRGAGSRISPRRRESIAEESQGVSSNAQTVAEPTYPKKLKGHEKETLDKPLEENLGTVKTIRKEQSEQYSHACSSQAQTESVQNSMKRRSHDTSHHKVNKNFPQGTRNTSTVHPFLGHSHTDFGPTPSIRSKGLVGQSEITGSEDERLRTIFRSDPMSDTNFEGFSNEEIEETELLHDSFTNKNKKETLNERLKSAALDVVYVPSSELGVAPPEDKSDSDSQSSKESLEVDIVFQNMENFPSDGSEWETQVQGFMTKLDEALEIRDQQAKRVQEDLKKAEEEMERKKRHQEEASKKEASELERQKLNLDRQKAESERESEKENITAGKKVCKKDSVETGVDERVHETDIVGDIAESVDATRSTTEQPVKSAKSPLEPLVQEKQTEGGRTLRPRKSQEFSSQNGLKRHDAKSLNRKKALQEISNTDRPGDVNEKPPAKFSTPKSRRHSLGKLQIPHVSFSPKVTVEEQEIIVNHYVHDGEEEEVSFPKLSSPAQDGWRTSPVKNFAGRSETRPSTPKSPKSARIRRRSLSSTDCTRPLLFLKLKLSPSSRRRSLPACPMSPPPSPFKKNPPPSPFKSPKTAAPQSRKSPPIFALLYDEGGRKKGLTPILVTNRRPNFSREILQPSLRLSVSKRRTRRASLEKRMPRTLAALNLSLPHLFDVFEFHDEASMDEGEGDVGQKVKTAECGTQTPPSRKPKPRSLSCPRSSKRLRRNPARRKLSLASRGGDVSSSDRPSTSGSMEVSRASLPDTVKGDVKKGEGVLGTFEGSELARPFDLPLSFYM